MASIQRRPDGRWRARHRGPDGRERARHFARKVDAERWLAAQTVAKARGDWTDPALSRVPVGEWAATWLASKQGLKPTAQRSYEGAWRTLVQPRWAEVPLGRVSYGDVVTWVAELTGRGLSPSRVRLALLALKQIMDLAVLDGRLARNVVAPVKAPRARRGEQRFLSHQQLGALAAECATYRTLILVLGYTGIRWGEARALRVRHVDLLRARLDIAENIPDGCDEAQTVVPKSHKRRVVPIPRFVADELTLKVATRRPDDLVFPNAAGGLLDNSNFRRHVFDPAVRALGLAPFTPHNLRDTAASLAVSAGANVKAVQRMLGHASAAMTLDVYAGLFNDDLDQVAERLHDAALDAMRTKRGPGTLGDYRQDRDRRTYLRFCRWAAWGSNPEPAD